MRTSKKKFTKKNPYKKQQKKDPLDRWALEPGFKANIKRCENGSAGLLFTNVTTNVPVILLTSIATGSSDIARVGDRVRYRSLTFKGSVNFVPVAGTAYPSDHLRLLIVYDRQSNGALPAVTDIVYNQATAGSTSYDPPAWVSRGRFKILRDFQIPAPGNIAAGAGLNNPVANYPSSKEFNLQFYKNLKLKIDAIFKGATAGIADIDGGAILLIPMGLQPAVSTPWQLKYSCALEYMDV